LKEELAKIRKKLAIQTERLEIMEAFISKIA
jgi:hypothetical protein